MDRIAELVGEARLTIDTGFSRFDETLQYDPVVITSVLNTLDVALALIATLRKDEETPK